MSRVGGAGAGGRVVGEPEENVKIKSSLVYWPTWIL